MKDLGKEKQTMKDLEKGQTMEDLGKVQSLMAGCSLSCLVRPASHLHETVHSRLNVRGRL